MTKTNRLKRNEPNDSNEKTKNDQNSTKKKSEIKNNAQGSFKLCSTPDLPHGEIQLSLYYHQLDVRRRGNLFEKNINTKVTYINVVNECRYLFLPLLTLWYSIWLAFRPENYI